MGCKADVHRKVEPVDFPGFIADCMAVADQYRNLERRNEELEARAVDAQRFYNWLCPVAVVAQMHGVSPFFFAPTPSQRRHKPVPLHSYTPGLKYAILSELTASFRRPQPHSRPPSGMGQRMAEKCEKFAQIIDYQAIKFGKTNYYAYLYTVKQIKYSHTMKQFIANLKAEVQATLPEIKDDHKKLVELYKLLNEMHNEMCDIIGEVRESMDVALEKFWEA